MSDVTVDAQWPTQPVVRSPPRADRRSSIRAACTGMERYMTGSSRRLTIPGNHGTTGGLRGPRITYVKN